MLKTPPGPDPLNGASFFVNGPAHGVAAGEIAQLLGIDPTTYPDSYSWARFKAALDSGPLHQRLAANPTLSYQVSELEKIAEQPEPQRFSAGAHGGTPAGTYAQVQKIFCTTLTADPGTIPIITTYFLHPDARGCPTPAEMQADNPRFRAQINAMAAATGNHPAVYLLELDAIGSSRCIQHVGSLGMWEQDLRFEVSKMSSLPHTVVYLEAGYSDGNSPGYTARVLNASGVRSIRGFWTNDTHLNWTSHGIRWGEKISRQTGGAKFVINTSANGHGPLKNRHPSRQGNEALCNPPGRGLGPQDTTQTGFAHVDAFLWTTAPGHSAGSCNGGPPAGTFWLARALSLAVNANQQLGPRYPSRPY
jgi:endoglucanase